MKYKTPKEKARKVFYCDSFSGVNTADDLLSVKESQLSECVNLWNPNGLLTSRPGLCNSVIAMEKSKGCLKSEMYEADINPVTVNGFSKIFAIIEEYGDRVEIKSFLTNRDNLVQNASVITVERAEMTQNLVELKNAIFINDTTVCESGVVLVLAICESSDQALEKRIEFYELQKENLNWEKINKEKLYTPTALINGRGNAFDAACDPEGKDPIKPTLLEEVNIVNGRFKAYYRTDGYSWNFTLPIKDLSTKPNDYFYVRYYYMDEVITFMMTGDYPQDIKKIGNKEITCNIDTEKGIVYFYHGNDSYPLPNRVDGNGLCVEAVKNIYEKDFDLFGGKSQSILADARLLRSSAEENSNKIYYSSKENYFYFCENNYFEVGGNSEPITAMAFQNRYLFAFKDNSIYRLKISDTPAYDIEKIIRDNKKMPDTTPNVTITKVHNNIGCDCPKSVQFCQNRLVWYHSSGAVYTLYGTNTYTEGSVYTLSPNIRNLLNIPYEDIEKISACAKDGYYFLNYMNKIFVMDGNVSGFTYLSGSPQKDGSGGLNWFYWELPQNIKLKSLYSLSRELFAVYEGVRQGTAISVAGFGGEQDQIIIDAETSGVANIRVTFASALFGTKTKEKKSLTKASMLLKGLHKVSFWVFSETDSGKEIKTTQGGTLKRQNLLCSTKNSIGAGIKMTGYAPIVIADIAFEFMV